MTEKLNILYAAFEAVPFIKTGGLGDVAGTLPGALKKAGCDVRVMLPKLQSIPQTYRDEMVRVIEFQMPLGWRNSFCGIAKLEQGGITYYFIENEYYFMRENPYGYYDDGERIAFFSKAVTESLLHLPDFKCDILHCNDWHTALSPVFLREFYKGIPLYDEIKTVFTVHNVKFQGQYSDFMLGDVLGFSGIPAAEDQLRNGDGAINYMKGALLYSDVLTTVSPSYAEELKDPFYGEGLDELFRHRGAVFSGIMNGIDTEVYNPKTDEMIEANFSLEDLSGKAQCKAALQKELGLEEDAEFPLVVMIGRLTEQKGLELVKRVLPEILSAGVQMAVLGTGDQPYEKMLRHVELEHPGRFSAQIRFDEELSHRMYAGADMLLMPSLFEPCGLAQMIAMAYGTLPVVRETGGLRDSVIPYNKETGEGNGFSFRNYNAHEMMFTLLNGADVFKNNKTDWNKLVRQAMRADFSWGKAAEQYGCIYENLHRGFKEEL